MQIFKRTFLLSLSVFLLSSDWCRTAVDATETTGTSPTTAPAIRTGVPYATQDKPQSKLWYDHGYWWAWLPTPTGSSVWQRTGAGWKELKSCKESLHGLPGQADVLCHDGLVDAVLVGRQQLATARMEFDDRSQQYHISRTPILWNLQSDEQAIASKKSPGTETATIAMDGAGQLWIAWDRDHQMWVRAASDRSGIQWSDPIVVGGPAATDDLCLLVALPGQVALLWSDQKNDTVWFRAHRDGDPANIWQTAIAVAKQNNTADDHLNAAAADDGTLFIASKNSVDKIGEPQQVLRIRRPNGDWENIPYAVLQKQVQPTRPIVLIGGHPQTLYLLQTVRSPRTANHFSKISMFISPVSNPQAGLESMRDLLTNDQILNDVTSCKQTLPDDAPRIVLASDNHGNVYEAELPRP